MIVFSLLKLRASFAKQTVQKVYTQRIDRIVSTDYEIMFYEKNNFLTVTKHHPQINT